MKQLNKRQLNILEYIRKNKNTGNKEIQKYLNKHFENVPRITIVRDLNKLSDFGLIKKTGKGRNISYLESTNKLLVFFDINEYFKKLIDEREIIERFNFEIFNELKDILNNEELQELNDLNNGYRKRIKKLSSTILKKEFERITIDLSWKSSHIEGNTYSLIDTEILIKENKEAKGHSKEETTMILNHKNALEYISDKKSDFKKITLRKIENIHRLLIKDLNISYGIRKGLVGITGTRYKSLNNEYQIKEALEKTVDIINKTKDPFIKAIIALAMISYIQPFEDGNKRTARLLTNAIFLANNFCPLSFRSINESDYKKAMILFYEQNSIRFLKKLFIQQFKFAIENYFI